MQFDLAFLGLGTFPLEPGVRYICWVTHSLLANFIVQLSKTSLFIVLFDSSLSGSDPHMLLQKVLVVDGVFGIVIKRDDIVGGFVS